MPLGTHEFFMLSLHIILVKSLYLGGAIHMSHVSQMALQISSFMTSLYALQQQRSMEPGFEKLPLSNKALNFCGLLSIIVIKTAFIQSAKIACDFFLVQSPWNKLLSSNVLSKFCLNDYGTFLSKAQSPFLALYSQSCAETAKYALHVHNLLILHCHFPLVSIGLIAIVLCTFRDKAEDDIIVSRVVEGSHDVMGTMRMNVSVGNYVLKDSIRNAAHGNESATEPLEALNATNDAPVS